MPVKKTEPTDVQPARVRLFKVSVEEPFEDGNLSGFFRELGYNSFWPRGEVRELPMWLIKRVEQSGGNFTGDTTE